MHEKLDFNTKIRIMHSKIAIFLSGLLFKVIKNEHRDFLYKEVKTMLWSSSSQPPNIKLTERAIELAIAKEWLKMNKENIIEVGAVTPYYFPRVIKDIIDPTDKHKLVNIHKSVFEVDLRGKNVLSISTVEHIGTGDYDYIEHAHGIDAICKIMKESNHCLITYPIGYNAKLDRWTEKHFNNKHIMAYSSGRWNNNWIRRLDKGVLKTKYRYTDFCASAIIIIEK